MNIKKITTFSVMIRRIHSDFGSCWDAFTSFLCSEDGLFKLFSLIFLLYFFTLFPINIVINIFRFFIDLCNPNFDARKEYYDLHTHSMANGGALSMDYKTFCNYGYSKPRQKVLKELERLLDNNNNILNGIILRDRMFPENSRQLMSKETNAERWYSVSFGNETNKDLFCLFQEYICFKKEGSTMYLSFDEKRKEIMEEQLSKLFNFRVQIKLT